MGFGKTFLELLCDLRESEEWDVTMRSAIFRRGRLKINFIIVVIFQFFLFYFRRYVVIDSKKIRY